MLTTIVILLCLYCYPCYQCYHYNQYHYNQFTKLNSNKIDYNDYVNNIRDGSITRLISRVKYDGSLFKGWQEQERSVRTVQGTLSYVLSKRFNVDNRIIVIGASRTDHGVHSRGQAIHFDIDNKIINNFNDMKHLEYTMNRMLPDDLKLYNMTTAPTLYDTNDLWHSRKSAIGKLYSYRFCHNTFVDPIRRHYVAPCRRMDINLFNDCLQLYQGISF